MIKFNYEVKVNNDKADLDKEIFLFKGNKNIHFYFSIKGARFSFIQGSGEDIIISTNATYAAVTIIKPNGTEVANAIAPVEDGLIHLKVTEDLIDEDSEIGDFDLVFDLFDAEDGAVTIPKIKGKFHVLDRPCATPMGELINSNIVDEATVDYAVTTESNEELVVFDTDGNYVKTVWKTGDKITKEKLNKLEESIYSAHTKLNNIANKTVVENGKLYLVRKDGTKIDTGTTLPTSSSGSGIDGREVELQKGTDYIQWRYVGDTDWNNLVALNDLRGAKGDKGDTGLSAYELAQQETGFAGTVEQWLNSLVGATPNLQIGTVETLASGSSATASITGTVENPLLNLGIPKGADGSGTGTGSSEEKEWRLINEITLTEIVGSITSTLNNDYKEILIIAQGKSGSTSNNTGMAITSYSENQTSGIYLSMSSNMWQAGTERTFYIYICAEKPMIFLHWKRSDNTGWSSTDGAYNVSSWNDDKGINKLYFSYGSFAEGNNFKIYGR